MNELDSLMECRCKEEYSIEKHGNGFALYWGRCQHRHGHNVLHITECSRMDILKHIQKKLNTPRIKEGYRLVPVEPDEAMINAGYEMIDNLFDVTDVYKAMLKAAGDQDEN